eukprot:4540568-Pyramimonas_sp.AAC.1
MPRRQAKNRSLVIRSSILDEAERRTSKAPRPSGRAQTPGRQAVLAAPGAVEELARAAAHAARA